jgi:hypothetical protein
MRSIAGRLVCFCAGLLCVVMALAGQDPRVGLTPGFRDAGNAVQNMELVTSLPKPDGFFDPREPAGPASPPEPPPNVQQTAAAPAPQQQPPQQQQPQQPQQQQQGGGLNFANSDLAFSRDLLVTGNFHGFNAYNIEEPGKARLLSSVVCPGGQGDVSIYGNLLFMSVEQTRGRVDCGTQGAQGAVNAERFRGVRIFDIRDIRRPRQIAAVQTCRGSHTHTLVSDPDDKMNVYIYGSGTGAVRSAEELEGCSRLDPKDDPNSALFSIDVIQVPLAAPQTARIVNRPRIFADPATGAASGLWQGGNHGPGTQSSRVTSQCHDITVFPEIGLAAGACTGNGILLDISDPMNPVRLDQVVDKSFAFWHSATFNNDGTKVIFTDEWGGGTRPRCRAVDPPSWGANAIFDIVDRKMVFRSYYKLPAPQSEQENCVAHNGSIIPVPGRDIMVQGWYQGGISVFDFTDSANPVEIAFFDRGPIDAKNLVTGGYWSAYWYNGHIYATEIARGVDVFKLTPSRHLSQNEIDAAIAFRSNEFNAQQQPKIVWPAEPVVARAYIDQLTRTQGIQAERARAVTAALTRADQRELDALAAQLERDAAAAAGNDAVRLRLLAANLRKK